MKVKYYLKLLSQNVVLLSADVKEKEGKKENYNQFYWHFLFLTIRVRVRVIKKYAFILWAKHFVFFHLAELPVLTENNLTHERNLWPLPVIPSLVTACYGTFHFLSHALCLMNIGGALRSVLYVSCLTIYKKRLEFYRLLDLGFFKVVSVFLLNISKQPDTALKEVFFCRVR